MGEETLGMATCGQVGSGVSWDMEWGGAARAVGRFLAASRRLPASWPAAAFMLLLRGGSAVWNGGRRSHDVWPWELGVGDG